MTASQTPEALVAELERLAECEGGVRGGSELAAETMRQSARLIRALSAPVSGEAVAWRCRLSPNGDWFDVRAEYVEQRIADGLEVQALGVLAAHPKPAGEGVEALREAAEQLRFMSANLRQTSDRSEDFKVLFHERNEVADNIDAILSTLSGGLGPRPAAQAVPGCDAEKGEGHG